MKFLLSVFSAFLTAYSVNAAILSWTNTAGGSWHVAANWFPNGIPGSGDTALVTNTGSYTVYVTNGAGGIFVSRLVVGGSGAPLVLVSKSTPFTAGICLITNGGTLMVSSNSTITPSVMSVSAGGAFILDSASTLAAAGMIFTNDGSVFANNNATFTVSNCVINAGGTFAVDGYATLTAAKYFVNAGGALTLSNAWMPGVLTIQSGGTLNFAAPNNTYIYGLTITNNGSVVWSSGGLSTSSTFIFNNGLWSITGNNTLNNGGSPWPVWINTGTLRKTGNAGLTSLDLINFQNAPNGVVDVQSGTLQFNGGLPNLFTGIFTNAASATFNFINGTWTDAGGTFSGGGTNNFSSGTFNLRTNVPTGLKFLGGDVWITGTSTFQNSGAITNLTLDGAALRGTNTVTGTLTMNAGSIVEKLTIATNGLFVIGGAANKLLYGSTIVNQGTVSMGDGVSVGAFGKIINSGLWQIIGDYNISAGDNNYITWTNTGVLRKASVGLLGYSQVDANFVNLSNGVVESLAGRLILNGGTTNQFGGTFNAVGLIDLANGTWTDAGGTVSGTGTNRFLSGSLNLRTNISTALKLVGGTVNITGVNTFQNFGAITNLTLDGATLAGNGVVSGGTLTMNAGTLTGQMTVQTNGQLLFAGSASKFLIPLVLTNLGTVTMNGSSVSVGTTTIYNYGLWQMPGDFGLSFGGVGVNAFTNFGTFRKTSGSGNSDCTTISFFNQSNALVQVDSGKLLLPASATNFAGTLRLNGGALGNSFALAGGTLDGAGTFIPNSFTSGTISPGVGGSGQINFSSGLNLNSNVTLLINGSGPVAGVSYDTLSVTGAVVLANASLQIAAMPTVAAGTTFTLINNDAADAVNGTFAGLPENSSITNGAQTFRIHYAAGTGNDVTLVRDGVITGPKLVMNFYANNAWTFTGSNAIPLTVFTVRASTNLVTWTNIGVVTSSVSGGWSFTDTNAWRYARRFYNTTN